MVSEGLDSAGRVAGAGGDISGEGEASALGCRACGLEEQPPGQFCRRAPGLSPFPQVLPGGVTAREVPSAMALGTCLSPSPRTPKLRNHLAQPEGS